MPSPARSPRPPSALWLLVLALLAPLTLADRGAEQRQQLDALKNRIQAVQAELRDRTRDRDQQSAALRHTELAAGRLRKQILNTETQLAGLQTELNSLQQQREQLAASKVEQETLIGQHLNAAYRLGRQEQIKLLLNEEDPARYNRLLKYHHYFMAARADKLTTYRATIDSLAEVAQAIVGKERQLVLERDTLKTQQGELSGQISERRRALAALKQQISGDQQQLQKLHGERRALEQVLQALAEAVAELALPHNSQPFAKRQGQLHWPVKGRLQQRFGNRRKADIRWHGWLLGAAAGTPVRAVHHGRVVFSDYLRGHGLLLIIDHGDGYMSLYAHNQVLLKETGDWVQGGELITRVGDSGGLDRSALYFEIRKNGKPRNPAKWLKKRA